MPNVVSFTPDSGSRVVGFEPDDGDSEKPQVVGFTPDDDSSDVKGGSSSTNDTYWQGVKSRFSTAVHNPMAAIGGALDPLLKPVRESLQQGGITGSMGPDIAKQAFGPRAGGFVEGLEKDVAAPLVSGENAAIMGGLAAAPAAVAAPVLAHFGKQGAEQAIASTQAPPNETPEEAGRRYARGAGGAAMALAPILHGAAGPVREAVSRFREPAAGLDFDAVNRESMGEIKRAPEPEVLDTKIEAPAEVRPVPPREATEPTFTGIADGDKFDVSPEKPLEVPRELQDAAAEIPEATELEIRTAAERLRALDESAGKPGADAGDTATGSLGESARPAGERGAGQATRSGEPLAAGATEAGEGAGRAQPDADAPAAGAKGVPVAADLVNLPGNELRHNQATVNEFRRMGGLDSIDESKFKTTETAIKAEAEKNIGKIIPDLMKRQVGEPITAVENAAVQAYIRHIVENPTPEGAAVLDHLSKFTYEGRSAVGRALGFGGSAMEEFLTDPGKAVQAAMQATKGKMSQDAKMDVAALAQKAKVRKERIDATLTQRAQSAVLRLEAEAKASLDRMRQDISKITVEDILKCR